MVSTICYFIPNLLHMKKLTAIQIAEYLINNFEDAQSIADINPNEAVFTFEVVINLLKKLGEHEPDIGMYGKVLTDKSIKDSFKIKAQLSARISWALREKGMTQKELAHKLGKSESTVSRQLSAQNITVETIIEIQTILGINLLNL